jgi:hypothetical protein
MKKKFFTLLLITSIMILSNAKSQTIQENIEKAAKDKSNVERAAKADVLIHKKVIYDDSTQTKTTSPKVVVKSTPAVNKWFKKDHESVSKGSFTISGDEINFSTTYKEIQVEYSGKIMNSETLQLHSKSLSNNNQADITYSFVQE